MSDKPPKKPEDLAVLTKEQLMALPAGTTADLEVSGLGLGLEVELGVRARAALEYVKSDVENREQRIDSLMKMDEFRTVARSKLLFWARQDRWEEQRIDFQNQWKNKVRLKLGSNLAQAAIKDFETLTGLEKEALSLMRQAPPGSYEGVGNFLLKLLKHKSELATKVLNEVAPEGAASPIEGAKKIADQHGLDAEALQEAARNLLVNSLPSTAPTPAVEVSPKEEHAGELAEDDGQ